MSRRDSSQPRRWSRVFHVKHSDVTESVADDNLVEDVAGEDGGLTVEDVATSQVQSSATSSVQSQAGSDSEALVLSAAPVLVQERPADPELPTETASSADADDSSDQEVDGDVAVELETVAETEAEVIAEADAELDPISLEPLRRDDESTPLARELTDITRRRRALASQKLPLPASTRIFTVANQKGGVGKTTSTVNLAAALARQGARVLVIDLDPQGNASTALGVEHRSETVSVYDVIINDDPMASAVQKSPEFDALFCLPATIHLAGAEIELVSLVAREQRLHTALETFLAESEHPFHYVFIDCPPSLGLLTINAFVAANEVLIPIQCEYYALEGLSQLLTNIQLIERHLNPKLAVSTILLTMFDSRTNLANQVAQEVRDHFPDQVLSTLIPRSVRISEAPSYGQSVISYDGNSSGSLSYLEAAAEIARRGVPQ
jgi:chromosome partitioning protein